MRLLVVYGYIIMVYFINFWLFYNSSEEERILVAIGKHRTFLAVALYIYYFSDCSFTLKCEAALVKGDRIWPSYELPAFRHICVGIARMPYIMTHCNTWGVLFTVTNYCTHAVMQLMYSALFTLVSHNASEWLYIIGHAVWLYICMHIHAWIRLPHMAAIAVALST